MTQIELTPSQRSILDLAVETNGRVESFPKNLGGGARSAVMRGLLLNGLIVADGASHMLTDAGYEAVGQEPPAKAEDGGDDATETDIATAAEPAVADEPVGAPGDSSPEAGDGTRNGETSLAAATSPVAAKAAKPPKSQKANRVEQVVALLMRPQGVTIKEVMEATDWQQHSVRGFFAGTLKKKGYVLISDKSGKEDRVYRIKSEARTEAEDDRAGHSDEAE